MAAIVVLSYGKPTSAGSLISLNVISAVQLTLLCRSFRMPPCFLAGLESFGNISRYTIYLIWKYWQFLNIVFEFFWRMCTF
jgi:hypothetical protein